MCMLIIEKKYFQIFVKGLAQGLDNTALTAEKEYAINFSEQQKKFCLSLYYNGINSYIIVNGVEIYKFKAQVSKINAAPLCLGNVSKYFPTIIMKKAALYRYFCDFLVDYDSINVSDILDIHKNRYP